MSLLYAVVFASRCRSNHHRLAVDALRHLQSPDAERRRNLLLHFHEDYLAGAKAPDEVFKDFKNHVLHAEAECHQAITGQRVWTDHNLVPDALDLVVLATRIGHHARLWIAMFLNE